MDMAQIEKSFNQAFGNGQPAKLFFAPGRVNLIGEHTDYNGGYVFPCALSLGTYGAARVRKDNVIRLMSGNTGPAVDLTLEQLRYEPKNGWANYPAAVVSEIIKTGREVSGFELYIMGDLPNGAGLSSSASVELLTCVALDHLFNLQMDPVERVRICQRAENIFVGVNCGIMDQFASGMGRRDHAVLLNCATLQYTYVPLKLGDYRLIITNTNKQHGLTDSKYNERRSQCEQALKDLQTVLDVECLCGITPDTFEQHKHLIENETNRRRAAHAVYENARTQAAVETLNAGDLAAFGKYMNESHVSLRDLYEVTGPELDALAEAAWSADGVLGSRMTGAGFGGCTVSIVRADAAERFIETVSHAYTARTGLKPDFYIAETGEGATILTY